MPVQDLSTSICAMDALIVVVALFLAGSLPSIEGSSCPEGEAADRFLLHFKPDHPKGVPGADLPEPAPLPTPLTVGMVTLVDTSVGGLSDTVLHNFSIYAHNFTAQASVSIPLLELLGTYELPGLWWTTSGQFSVKLQDVRAVTHLTLAVVEDSCFYIEDYQTTITKSNFSYSTEGLLDDSGMLDFFFDDLIEILVNVTKPTILDMVNQQIRIYLTSFLPTPTEEFPLQPAVNPTIPPRQQQVEALVRFVRFQIPWMLGDPLELTDVTLNIMAIAELHNMTVHNLEKVTQVQHLSLEYDGNSFTMTTKMLHQAVFNKHRVLWFPGTFFKTWQWTTAHLGLVKHKSILVLDRRLQSPPRIAEFYVRPVVFNPDHSTGTVRGMDRFARRLLDGIRTEFGDDIRAFLYSPIVSKVNKVLRQVDARMLIKNFVCFAAGSNGNSTQAS